MEVTEDWTEKLIRIISERPAIYDKRLKEHMDRDYVTYLWTEVGQEMFSTWNEMSQDEKSAKGKELLSRWRNLRTCFLRELDKQRKCKFGPNEWKRRKYIYFDNLKFLLPSITENETRQPNSETRLPRTDKVDETRLGLPKNDSFSDDTSKEKGKSDVNLQHIHPVRTEEKKKTLNYEEILLSILKDKKNEEIDEDRYFLLSLVSTFKNMNDSQKLKTKISILSIINNILCNPSNVSPSPVKTLQPPSTNSL